MTSFGYTIGDWVGIISIIGSILTALIFMGRGLVKYAKSILIEPLIRDLQRVSKSIDELTESSRSEHKVFEDRLDSHDRRLDRHSVRLKNVEKEVFRHEN